jgi:hypothetical protein
VSGSDFFLWLSWVLQVCDFLGAPAFDKKSNTLIIKPGAEPFVCTKKHRNNIRFIILGSKISEGTLSAGGSIVAVV